MAGRAWCVAVLVAVLAGCSTSPADPQGRAACSAVVRLLNVDLSTVQESELTAIEQSASRSTHPTVVDAGLALGRARAVWVRDKARFTAAEDQRLVEAGLFSAFFTMVEVCGKAGLLKS